MPVLVFGFEIRKLRLPDELSGTDLTNSKATYIFVISNDKILRHPTVRAVPQTLLIVRVHAVTKCYYIY